MFLRDTEPSVIALYDQTAAVQINMTFRLIRNGEARDVQKAFCIGKGFHILFFLLLVKDAGIERRGIACNKHQEKYPDDLQYTGRRRKGRSRRTAEAKKIAGNRYHQYQKNKDGDNEHAERCSWIFPSFHRITALKGEKLVEHPMSGFILGHKRQFLIAVFGDERYNIRIDAEACTCCSEAVGTDHVTVL